MPIRVFVDKKELWISPNTEWQTTTIEGDLGTLRVDKNFYIEVLKTN
jgi:hypothetical protein